MKSVAVFHPLLQHSHQLAWAIYEKNLLQKYYSGIPVRYNAESTDKSVVSYLNKIKSIGVPNAYKINVYRWLILIKLVAIIKNKKIRDDWTHKIFHLFDEWAASEITRIKPKLVVGFENSSHLSFLAAKKIGAICVLDAPSIHWRSAESLINIESSGYIETINKKKDQEVFLADYIITCSDLARDTYIKNGVPSDKLKTMRLGASLPKSVSKKNVVVNGGIVRFIFAGVMCERKSIDIILNVFSDINKNNIQCYLDIVGGTDSDYFVGAAKEIKGVSYFGQLSQVDMYEKMAKADCLLLPSRFDSFGMVVAEAMAVGLPAIVSNMTGACEIIKKYPNSGWIVEPTYDSLMEKIKYIVDNPSCVASASECALQAAKEFTWEAYRERVGNFVLNVLV